MEDTLWLRDGVVLLKSGSDLVLSCAGVKLKFFEPEMADLLVKVCDHFRQGASPTQSLESIAGRNRLPQVERIVAALKKYSLLGSALGAPPDATPMRLVAVDGYCFDSLKKAAGCGLWNLEVVSCGHRELLESLDAVGEADGALEGCVTSRFDFDLLSEISSRWQGGFSLFWPLRDTLTHLPLWPGSSPCLECFGKPHWEDFQVDQVVLDNSRLSPQSAAWATLFIVDGLMRLRDRELHSRVESVSLLTGQRSASQRVGRPDCPRCGLARVRQ